MVNADTDNARANIAAWMNAARMCAVKEPYWNECFKKE